MLVNEQNEATMKHQVRGVLVVFAEGPRQRPEEIVGQGNPFIMPEVV